MVVSPHSALFTLTSPSEGQWRFHGLDTQRIWQHVSHVLTTQEELHQRVRAKVLESRSRLCQGADSGELTNFHVGDFVWVARVRRPRVT